ncbi:hypothetical protein MBLNU230_g0465t1 [Neophaeotheca triangularis]
MAGYRVEDAPDTSIKTSKTTSGTDEQSSSRTRVLLTFVTLLATAIAAYYGYDRHQTLPTLVPGGITDRCIFNFDHGFPIDAALQQVQILQSHSWEYSTAAEALLEFHHPDLAVFSPIPFPAGKIPQPGLENKALTYVRPFIRTDGDTLSPDDYSATDPASLGVFAILLGQQDPKYLQAATRQKDHLLTQTPRHANGALSHRTQVAELWDDAVHMLAPFLAYYAVVSNDLELMRQAVRQCQLYREVMVAPEGPGKGLWKHIVGPSEMADEGFWSTGVAWAAYGMVRLRATVSGWRPSNETMEEEVRALDGWVLEILDGAIRTDDDWESGLLRNYLGDDSWFGEVSGTALLASTVLRMAGLGALPEGDREKYLAWAGAKRDAVLQRVDGSGVAKPAVNPLKHGSREPLMTGSPEGQSFLVIMSAAWRDCICKGLCTPDEKA